ncbi:MAG: Stp1/IreP family PP2C-type Ser/Thr phosphatase [bacterium]
MTLRYASRTDVGRVRKNNEDAVLDPQRFPAEAEGLAHHGWLFIVADGMGGALGGEVASNLAIETIHRLFYQAPADMSQQEVLRRAILTANQVVYERSELDPDLSGMGTTVTAVSIQDIHAHVAQVGDRRCYLYRQGHLQQITRDHSYVQEMLERGYLTPEEASDHPYKNRITRVVGTESTVEVDLFDLELLPADILLLCSDGLTGELSDPEMEDILTSAATPTEVVDRMLGAALAKEGRDNISVIVIQAEQGSERTGPKPKSWRKLILLVVGLILFLTVLGLLLWLFWPQLFPPQKPFFPERYSSLELGRAFLLWG